MIYRIPFSIKEPIFFSQYKEFLSDEYKYYCEERKKIQKEIDFALNDKIISYSYKNWFRLVSTKYSNDPLSCKGAMKNETGGRFNIGNIDKDQFSTFPALYIGNEKETCIKEIYSGMEDFFKAKKGEAFFRVSGCINSVLDLTKKGSLNKFVKTIKKINLSEPLRKKAKRLKLKERNSIQNVTQLKNRIYDINWKHEPNLLGIPSTSQIFGRLVKGAGIEAILYRSTKKAKKGLCLAIFPENFEYSDSSIELKDTSNNMKNIRIDSENF